MSDRWILILGFAAMFAVVLVRRFRRSFGRQPFRPAGLVFVVVLMSLVATILLLVSRVPATVPLAGAAAGIALALAALARTRFGSDETGRFYVPDGTIGLLVLTVFFGRVLWRLRSAGDLLARADGAAAAPVSRGIGSSPGTMLVLYLLLGYYVAYYGGVLWRGSRLATARSTPAA